MAGIAEIIHAHEAEIVRRWVVCARAAASARGLSTSALENLMPTYLGALADQLQGMEVDQRRRTHVLDHVASRLRQGFDLTEILDEFVLLERSIVDVAQSVPEARRPAAHELEILRVRIRGAMADATDAFHHHMLEDEQSDKRYSRRLQAIASEALHDATRPLRDRLRDVLDVVMEAMVAQCAAFLVYDIRNGELVLVASVGVESLEPYATSLDLRSFAGEIANRAEPTSLVDAATTSLEVPDALRRSGIRGLLGVRLPPYNDLFGVMYIGIAEAREFTPRELRRLASLAERLSLHFENARLFDELRAKIAALDVERALRERFVATLAHDLRGPLSAAQLAAELLVSDPAGLDVRRDLAIRIERNIQRIERMIRDLLDANRIRAGEPLPLRLDACDLGALAERVAEEARALHGDRFEVEVGEQVRGIWSEEELHRALWNLVTNAVKYGAPKQPIAIAVARHDDRVSVSVHNAGTPIPAAVQEYIFDAYARAPGADSGGRTGWGLGLTLVRGVAEAHGGRVSVTSESSTGTTFRIELPLDTRTASTSDHPAATVH